MAPYYTAVIFLNIFISAMLYFTFGKKLLSIRSVVSISTVSLLTGLLFPTLVGYFNIYLVLILGLLAVATGSYYLVKRDFVREENAGDTSVELPAEPPVELVEQEISQDLTQTREYLNIEILPEQEAIKNPTFEPAVSTGVKKASKKKQKKKKKQKLKPKQTVVTQETGSEFISEPVALSADLPEREIKEAELIVAEVQETEVQEAEVQETKVQETEIQETEIQETEVQETEIQETEIQETEIQETEIQETEIQEIEIQETEIQEIEIQETEIQEVEVQAVEIFEEETPDLEILETAASESETAGETPLMEQTTGFDDYMEDSSVRIQTQPSGDSEELRESYIMRGFDAKGAGDYLLAVKYFESAIELNPPVDLAEMMQFDIYTMLRELGYYPKAQESLAMFLERYGSQLSAELTGEIKSQIKYIEILQDMLNKANSPKMPYSRVPALIKMSAEEKFNVWKSESLY